MKSNLKITISVDGKQNHPLRSTGILYHVPTFCCFILSFLAVFSNSLIGQSVQFKSSAGGNRIAMLSSCNACTNNLIANPNFQQGLNNWTVLNPTFISISYPVHSSPIFCSTKDAGLSQTVKGIIAGQQYRFSVNAKKGGTAKCRVNIQFLDENANPVDTIYNQEINAVEFQPYEVSVKAPSKAKMARVGIWILAGACMSVEDWCLTAPAAHKLYPDPEPTVTEYPTVTNLTKIKAYPNPAKDRFWLLLPESFADFQEAKLVVTNALGKVMLSKSISGEGLSSALEISTAGLNTGVYLVSIVPLHHKPMTTQVVVTK